MRSIIVKELMVPLEEYAIVSQKANLREAVLALEEAQKAFDPSKHKHRAVLVLDENKNVLGKITMFDVLMALKPKYEKLEEIGMLSRSGYNQDTLEGMVEDNIIWERPLEFICSQAAKLDVHEFMEAPAEGAYIDENTTLDEAINQLVLQKQHSLLVTGGDTVTGVLRLSDVFTKICNKIKTCEL